MTSRIQRILFGPQWDFSTHSVSKDQYGRCARRWLLAPPAPSCLPINGDMRRPAVNEPALAWSFRFCHSCSVSATSPNSPDSERKKPIKVFLPVIHRCQPLDARSWRRCFCRPFYVSPLAAAARACALSDLVLCCVLCCVVGGAVPLRWSTPSSKRRCGTCGRRPSRKSSCGGSAVGGARSASCARSWLRTRSTSIPSIPAGARDGIAPTLACAGLQAWRLGRVVACLGYGSDLQELLGTHHRE